MLTKVNPTKRKMVKHLFSTHKISNKKMSPQPKRVQAQLTLRTAGAPFSGFATWVLGKGRALATHNNNAIKLQRTALLSLKPCTLARFGPTVL
jgi:hypothetical protein